MQKNPSSMGFHTILMHDVYIVVHTIVYQKVRHIISMLGVHGAYVNSSIMDEGVLVKSKPLQSWAAMPLQCIPT